MDESNIDINNPIYPNVFPIFCNLKNLSLLSNVIHGAQKERIKKIITDIKIAIRFISYPTKG